MTDLFQFRGEQYQLSGQAMRSGVPINLLAAGTLVQFFAKRSASDTDANAVIAKDGATAPAVAPKGGVSLAANGAYAVNIQTADTSAFTKTELLVYEVWLTEPDGTRTMIDHGALKVQMA